MSIHEFNPKPRTISVPSRRGNNRRHDGEVIDALAVAFHEHGLGHAEMPPKPGVHSQPDAFIHAMPAYIPALHAIGMKWVSGYPGNQAQGAALHHRPADPERR